MIAEEIVVDGYERVIHFTEADFSAYIALHSTILGPAIGGCRVRKYDQDEDALQDVLKLSQGMTFKNAAAGLNYGGGKCVVNAPAPTPENMRLVGEAVETFDGQYITAEDIGTGIGDMKWIAEATSHVVTGRNGDASVWTARGLASCMAHLPVIMRWPEFHETAVWVQGLGKVGWHLCEQLCVTGHKLYVSDIVESRVERAVSMFGATKYDDSMTDLIHVYAPCAIGGVITKDNADTIKFPVICGSANNQLDSDDLAETLMHRGILYCPDFIVNAGGVIAATTEIEGKLEHEVVEHVKSLGIVLDNVVSMAKFAGYTPLDVAKGLAGIRL